MDFEIVLMMKLCIFVAMVAIIPLVSSDIFKTSNYLDMREDLHPEDAWKIYNSRKRPPNSGIKMSEKEYNMR